MEGLENSIEKNKRWQLLVLTIVLLLGHLTLADVYASDFTHVARLLLSQDVPQIYFPEDQEYLLAAEPNRLGLFSLPEGQLVDSFATVSDGKWRFLSGGKYVVHQLENIARLSSLDCATRSYQYRYTVPTDINLYDISPDGSRMIIVNPSEVENTVGFKQFSLPDVDQKGSFNYDSTDFARSIMMIRYGGNSEYLVTMTKFTNNQWDEPDQIKLQAFPVEALSVVGETKVKADSWDQKFVSYSRDNESFISFSDYGGGKWGLMILPKFKWLASGTMHGSKRPLYFYYPVIKPNGLYYAKIKPIYPGEDNINIGISFIDDYMLENLVGLITADDVPLDKFKCEFVGEMIAVYSSDYTGHVRFYSVPDLIQVARAEWPGISRDASIVTHQFSRDGKFVAVVLLNERKYGRDRKETVLYSVNFGDY